MKTITKYILCTGVVEIVYLSLLAIIRLPINRLVVPMGLVLYITTITALSFISEKRLFDTVQTENNKKSK